jgi:hypothetical protein
MQAAIDAAQNKVRHVDQLLSPNPEATVRCLSRLGFLSCGLCRVRLVCVQVREELEDRAKSLEEMVRTPQLYIHCLHSHPPI